MTSLVLTITETLRYRGNLGQWAWVLHRLAGLGTLVFVVLHVVDTSWATFYPELYGKAIAAYKTPLYTIGEFGLVACVVYHALNGFRITLFDWRPRWWKHQANAVKIVLLGTIVILVPVFAIMFGHVVNYYNTHEFTLGLEAVVESASPFLVGLVVVLGAALVASVAASFIPGIGGAVDAKTGKRQRKTSRVDSLIWSYMRISGVLIIPLVFGHLLMIHVIQGVFDITLRGHVPVGTTLGPNVASDALLAANFVALRWNTTFAGVFIWRIYDILLLVLIVLHGAYGARYIVNDYIRNRILNRALAIGIVSTAIILLVLGSLAIINTVPATTEKMMGQQSSQVISESAR